MKAMDESEALCTSKDEEELEQLVGEGNDEETRQEAERAAAKEAGRKAAEEAERRAAEEAEKKAKEVRDRAEAEQRAFEDAEADRVQREEQKRKAREEAEWQAKEEAGRQARERAERKAKEEAERKAREMEENDRAAAAALAEAASEEAAKEDFGNMPEPKVSSDGSQPHSGDQQKRRPSDLEALGHQQQTSSSKASASDRALAEAAIRMVANPDVQEGAWEDAARWEMRELDEEDTHRLLDPFGYRASRPDCWIGEPEGDPQLQLQLHGHFERAGHTWYNLRCAAVLGKDRGPSSINWTAPRRLQQLRSGLYNRVCEKLGSSYDTLFGDVHFARHGSVGGTSERIQAWMSTLSTLINTRSVPPSVVALVVEFVQGAHALNTHRGMVRDASVSGLLHAPKGAARAAEDEGESPLVDTRTPSSSSTWGRSSSSSRLMKGSSSLLRSLSGFFGTSDRGGVIPPKDGSGQSLLKQDISKVDDAWFQRCAAQLAQETECTKVGRNGKPYARKIRIDSKSLMLEVLGGRTGDVGVPLDDLVDVLQGICSKEILAFYERYKKVTAEEELARRAMVLQTPVRTFSFLFSSGPQCNTVGMFVVTLLKSKNRGVMSSGVGAVDSASSALTEPPESGEAKVIYPNFSMYDGQYQGHMRHGQGVLTLSDGTRYECQWQDDHRHGTGVERWPDQTYFSGSYLNGLRNGPGEMSWPDGARYFGNFDRGRANGQGELVRTDGTVYRGSFSEDCMCGEGHMEWRNGSCRYEGQFMDNKREGQGTMVWASGAWKSYEGQWKSGVYHGFGTLTDQSGGKVAGHFHNGHLQDWDKRSGAGAGATATPALHSRATETSAKLGTRELTDKDAGNFCSKQHRLQQNSRLLNRSCTEASGY